MVNNFLFEVKINTFAERLKHALGAKGFGSTNSKFGVQAAPIAKNLGISVQMIRKYLTGQSQPEYRLILNIAKFLEVSPCWLTFGDPFPIKQPQDGNFFIEEKFLKEICNGLFSEILGLNFKQQELNVISEFMYGLINDTAQLNATDDVKFKLIKTAIKSACLLENNSWKKLTILT